MITRYWKGASVGLLLLGVTSQGSLAANTGINNNHPPTTQSLVNAGPVHNPGGAPVQTNAWSRGQAKACFRACRRLAGASEDFCYASCW